MWSQAPRFTGTPFSLPDAQRIPDAEHMSGNLKFDRDMRSWFEKSVEFYILGGSILESLYLEDYWEL